jgi:hypothetical protein
MPLEITAIQITALNHKMILNIEVIPNKREMVTAIQASDSKDLKLIQVEVLKTIGAFEAIIELQDSSMNYVFYVVDGLLHLLIGRGQMKELELLHPNFIYHLRPACFTHQNQQP